MALKYIEYEKLEVVKPEWLWSGFFRFGKVCLMTGEGGMGKSTLTYKLVAAVTTGAVLPGQEKPSVPPSFCIIQNSEDIPSEDTLPQLIHFGADVSKVRSIDTEGEPLTLLDPRFEEAVADLNAKLLIIDPYTAFLGNSSMYSPQAMRNVLNHLQDIAQKYKRCVILIGHVNKNESAKASNRHLGSSDIRHALRAVLVVGRYDGNIYAIAPEKMSRGRRVDAMSFELSGSEDDENLINFEWRGECDATADELLNGSNATYRDDDDEPESYLLPIEKAMMFLRETLGDDPVDKDDVVSAAAEQGIKYETLRRAREKLGVVTAAKGNRSQWSLPREND